MAKVGPKEGGQFDPFNMISDSLTALKESPPVADKQQSPEAVPNRTSFSEGRPVERPEKPSEADARMRSEPPPEVASSHSQKVSRESSLTAVKRFKTTREEAVRLERAAVQLGARLGISVDFSKLTRALWDTYLRHEEDILRNVPENELWERPANNDAVGLAELDDRLAELIHDGFMVASRRPRNLR